MGEGCDRGGDLLSHVTRHLSHVVTIRFLTTVRSTGHCVISSSVTSHVTFFGNNN